MDVADLVYIDETGYHYADYPTFLAWLQDEYRTIYGADVYLESDSQDGQFLAILAKALYDTAALGAATFNSFSPVTAQGVGLSRDVKINGLNRITATYSTADLTIVGQGGTVITNGVVVDTLDQKWDLPASVTIPGGGTIVVTATSQVAGAVNAQADTINSIFTPTRGWQTVNNSAEATPGVPVETDAELRARQQVSTANPSLTVFEGSNGAVANLSGVTQVRGYENDTGSTDANGILAHSISTMVVGGDADEIAQTIATHKTPGTGTVGTTTKTVYDSHGMPLAIKFTRPTAVVVGVQITLSARVGWTTDYEVDIAAAVAAVVEAFGIGNDVLLSRMFSPAYLPGLPGTTYDIVSIEMQADMGGFSAANVDIDFDEYPTCDPEVDVEFVVT